MLGKSDKKRLVLLACFLLSEVKGTPRWAPRSKTSEKPFFGCFPRARARPAFFDFCLHRFTFWPQVVEM